MRHILLGSLLVLIAWVVPLSAEEAEAPPIGKSEVTATGESPMGPLTRLRVSYSGGVTLKQGLEAIQRAVPGKVQFVVGSDVGQIPIPDVVVQDARVIDVLNLLGTVIPDLSIRVAFAANYLPLREVVGYAFEDQDTIENESGWKSQTCMVIVGLSNQDEDERPIRREMRMFRLGEILESTGTTVEDFATAVETVWGLGSQQRVASLRFHKETKLLICYGSPEHILLAERVIERISGEDAPPSYVNQTSRYHDQVAGLERVVKAVKNNERMHANRIKQLDHKFQQVHMSLLQSIDKLEKRVDALAK